jgi:multidrug efflux system membrane fusion protein
MSRLAPKKIMLATMAALLLTAGGGYYALQHKHARAAEEAAAVAPATGAMPVKVIVAEEKPVRLWNAFSGRLAAVDRVELRPQVGGEITEVRFEDGQMVEKGDILFVIDPRPYKARVEQAEADLKAAENQLALAKKDLTRASELVKTSAISERIFDERESGARVAQNTVDAAAARLEQARIDLDYAYVKAPISGRISRAEITVGNLVQPGPGAPLLTAIVSNEGIYADFEVDEKLYLHSLRNAGDDKIPVKLSLQSDETASYEGYIKSFDNQIDTTSGTIRARALFANEDGALLPGMFVSVQVGSATAENRIMIPEQALSTDQDRKFVYTVSDDGKVVYRPVTPGASVAGQREIKDGLKPGDKIIIDGLMKLRPDMPVTPQIAGQETVPAPAIPDTTAATEQH